MAHVITTLDDGQTWGGPGTVHVVPDEIYDRYQDADNLVILDEAGEEVYIGDQPGVVTLGVDHLVALHEYLTRRRIRDPKLKRLVKRSLM